MRPHIRGIGMTSQRTRDRLIDRLREKGIRSEAVLEVMRRTPRHLFVDEALSSRAYEDTALPIGFNQTISQPYIVARMTEALLAEGIPTKVLEVGTGSGYQAAVLAQLVPRVYTVERIDALVRSARQRFRTLELRNIQLKQSDGSWGWPQQAPFDAILVTAAPAEIPRPLLEQLADGGRLVIPVGGASGQTLTVVTRRGDVYEREDLEPVSFVPLVGGAG
ncbi:MAG: protein-L-isoaspartate(D-aspartate) O-methyltransferase [Gammaproteobacteria bacterium]|nr:protein-L-isoaspartate(D-aspartate) O-methyltransferase [Gammaproteobacteria bacterium]